MTYGFFQQCSRCSVYFSKQIIRKSTGLIVIALGAGLGVWGVVNMLEDYGNDNPGAMTGCHTEDRPKCRMDAAQTKRLPKVSRVSSSLWLAAVSLLSVSPLSLFFPVFSVDPD